MRSNAPDNEGLCSIFYMPNKVQRKAHTQNELVDDDSVGELHLA
jgi:hypothetical protein